MCKPHRLIGRRLSPGRFYAALFASICFLNASVAQPALTLSKTAYPTLAKMTTAALSLLAASDSTPFIVGDIYITGNKKTRSYVIERELSFKKGDTVNLRALVGAFRSGHDNLVNTHLFGVTAAHAPVWQLRKLPGGELAGLYIDSFERVWETATPLDGA